MSRTRTLIVLGVVAAVTAGAVTAERWWHNRPPYSPSVLHASAKLQPLTDDQAQAFLGPMVNAPRIGAGGQLIAGELTWQKPPTSEGYFSVYVIDMRTHLKPPIIATDDSRAAVGANSWDTKVAARYPWLQGAGAVYRDGSWWDSGEDLTLPMSSGATSVKFVAAFPKTDPGDPNSGLHATAPVDVSHLLVGLVFIGGDSQIYWPQRLHG